MKIATRERWSDGDVTYTELRLGRYEACCIKETSSGLRYILECDDGNDVYSDIAGSDFPLRKLTNKERKEVIDYISNIKD